MTELAINRMIWVMSGGRCKRTNRGSWRWPRVPLKDEGEKARESVLYDQRRCSKRERPSTKVHAVPCGRSSLGYLFGNDDGSNRNVCCYISSIVLVANCFMIQERPSTKVHAAPCGGSSLGYLFGNDKCMFCENSLHYDHVMHLYEFNMKDVLVFLDDPQYNPLEGLGTEENFKKFHMVMDHSDHPFSAERSTSQQEKELILLMVKAVDLEISMHGDYYGMLVTDPKR
ncbi:SPIRAL1-like protein 1 [Tanacetum coccineum]